MFLFFAIVNNCASAITFDGEFDGMIKFDGLTAAAGFVAGLRILAKAEWESLQKVVA